MIDQRLMPYYATRALISLLFGLWAAAAWNTGFGGLLLGLLLFAGFLWYAHSSAPNGTRSKQCCGKPCRHCRPRAAP
jgi:hypothetical protein